MTDFQRLFDVLAAERVDFVLIGGLAVIAHGYQRATVDLDVCYARTRDNLRRIVDALSPLHPRLRGAPPDLKFPWDVGMLENGLNFTLVCDAGEIDLLGEVPGLGNYDDIAPGATTISLYGRPLRMLNLEQLIKAKAAAGRLKDLLDLEALRKLRDG